eukprot:CAMPEP_0183746072 /NCGR_PEP_ID=MMETSP0737-20130205/66565_1 /TAXON_ID=385413 /ORGANISM="Thalassiosira miniscula, Strain CCMP1093" /LENGTH=147 /DNA_ID=CAMNT_0025981751 /DNA_START=502 /DNA_END=945 /DNA_ORIENTATION=+
MSLGGRHFWYLHFTFVPLQGSWNLLIFIYPKVVSAKSNGSNVTWWQAFVSVIFPKRKSPNNTQKGRGQKKDNMSTQPAQQSVDAEEGQNQVKEAHAKSSTLHGSQNADEDARENGIIRGDSSVEYQQRLQVRRSIEKTEHYFKAIEC